MHKLNEFTFIVKELLANKYLLKTIDDDSDGALTVAMLNDMLKPAAQARSRFNAANPASVSQQHNVQASTLTRSRSAGA